MAEYQDEKLRMMEDEMNRFEAEIAAPSPPGAPPGPIPPHGAVPPHMARAVIGANTYNQVQRRLEEQKMPDFHPGGMFCPPMMNMLPSFVGIPPPPPPPPPLLIPHQLQHRPIGPPRPSNMQMRPMEMMHQNYNMNQNHNMNQNQHQRPQFNGPSLPPPPPPGSNGPSSAVVSVAPLLYNPKPNALKLKPRALKTVSKPATFSAPPAVMDTYASFQNELSQLEEQKPNKRIKLIDKYESLHAKDMAAKVKASATVMQSVVPAPAAAAAEEPATGAGGRKKKNKKLIRMAGGQTWEDGSLGEWEDDDYRIFCGDLGNDVTDEILTRTFNKYASFLKAKVVRDKRSNKTKGFGFVSFKDPQDFIKAMKEMNGRYVGSRPIKLRKSSWKSRNLDNVRKKEKEKTALIGLLTGR